MNVIPLGSFELFMASTLVMLLAFLSFRHRVEIERPLLIAALRTTIQLSLIGLVLNVVFTTVNFWLVLFIWTVMLCAAGYEVMARQKIKVKGSGSFFIGTSSMMLSSFSIMVLILALVIKVDPWYSPRYAIPILGMLLGNTMNGIALAMNTFSGLAWSRRATIEQRLALGQPSVEAIEDIWRESVRTGLIPIINSMAAAGLVSLPGMMTGQILAGNTASDAVRYQILIMFMISSGTGFGVILSLWLMRRKMFDGRERLRLKDGFTVA
ncbi:MAG: iron export ABC transporter permease subunit FetB [Erysipelotrichia bacterium]|nr:iron export ABC transporter permease subunit FetB [Candidatus Riflebacteria bacterium]NCB38212.1 iron export ABC transporter permease subunit FetB [Erysipelotrichia bacterium]